MRKPPNLLGCSAFCLQSESAFVVGRNLDVPFEEGCLLTNPRDIDKQSVVGSGSTGACWRSRWGSLTFNLLGRGLPMGGINESGLVVEHLFMPGTVYPEARGRKVLLEFEWIQYMLDICSEVSDLISSAQDVAIAGDRVPMHFLAVDRTGACALLEFREGQLELHRGNRFQPPVVTNDWYEDSLRYLETLTGGAGLESPPATSMQSLDRFARLALLLKELPPVDDLEIHERAMSMLDSVLDNTLLSVVYQPENGTVQYRSKGNPDRRRVRIADFDFSPTAKPLMLDIHLDTQAMEGFDVEAMRRCLASTLAIGRDFLKLDPYLDRMTD